jgi:hypothetical protein
VTGIVVVMGQGVAPVIGDEIKGKGEGLNKLEALPLQCRHFHPNKLDVSVPAPFQISALLSSPKAGFAQAGLKLRHLIPPGPGSVLQPKREPPRGEACALGAGHISLLKTHFPRLIKNAWMQGARGAFHLPVRQAILRVALRRIRSYFLPRRRVGEPARGALRVRCSDEGRGKRRRWAFFNSLTSFDPYRNK